MTAKRGVTDLKSLSSADDGSVSPLATEIFGEIVESCATARTMPRRRVC